jgi:hypothetical protein
MKRLIYCFVFMLLALSCSKTKNFYNDLGQGSYLTFVNSKTFLNGLDAAAAVQLTVKATGAAPQSVNVFVSATATTDSTKWVLLKNVPFKDSAILSVTNEEIAKALGLTAGNLPPSVIYNLYNQIITKDGRHFSSANTSAVDLENQPAFNTALQWTAVVVCAYDASSIAGTYAVVEDDWQDWQPGDSVVVTVGPKAGQIDLSQVWPNPAFANIVSPFIISVDPATGLATIPSLTFGDYGNTTASTLGGTGFIFSCKNRISLQVHITTSAFGDQGINQLILQK